MPAVGQALYQESGHRDGWGSPWLGGFTEILHRPPNSSKEASSQCRQAQRKEGKGKEGFWRKSATDVQTYFPSGSSESRWGDPATPGKSTTQVEMTGVLEHVHTRWRGTEGPYGRLVLWGMSLGA